MMMMMIYIPTSGFVYIYIYIEFDVQINCLLYKIVVRSSNPDLYFQKISSRNPHQDIYFPVFVFEVQIQIVTFKILLSKSKSRSSVSKICFRNPNPYFDFQKSVFEIQIQIFDVRIIFIIPRCQAHFGDGSVHEFVSMASCAVEKAKCLKRPAALISADCEQAESEAQSEPDEVVEVEDGLQIGTYCRLQHLTREVWPR